MRSRSNPFFARSASVLQDQALDGPGLFGIGSAQTHGKDDLPQVGLEPRDGREVFAQSRIDEGLAKGACRRADQGVGGNAKQQHLLGVRVFRHHPGQVHGRFAGKALALAHGVAVAHGARFRPPGLEPDGRIDAHLAEAAQDVLQEGQVILRRDAAVEEEIGIRGGIVEPVELPELLPGEPGDDLGVAAGIESVGVVGKEILLERLVHEPVGRRVGPLHLVVDDARDGEIACGVIGVHELQVVPFLEKGLLQDPGLEHQVGVDPRQVEVIDGHLACHGVEGLVGVGEGVDEGLQGCPRKLVEGVLHRVGARSRPGRSAPGCGRSPWSPRAACGTPRRRGSRCRFHEGAGPSPPWRGAPSRRPCSRCRRRSRPCGRRNRGLHHPAAAAARDTVQLLSPDKPSFPPPRPAAGADMPGLRDGCNDTLL